MDDSCMSYQNWNDDSQLIKESQELSEGSNNSLEASDLERSMRKNNGRSRGGRQRGNKVYYFDSNDEMFCGSEVSFTGDEVDEDSNKDRTKSIAELQETGDSGNNGGNRKPLHMGSKHY